jgi:hypothetical protein
MVTLFEIGAFTVMCKHRQLKNGTWYDHRRTTACHSRSSRVPVGYAQGSVFVPGGLELQPGPLRPGRDAEPIVSVDEHVVLRGRLP